jgi:lysophospholipid acyltransferase (LPLAT)-like uncharacterized protein
VAWLLRAVARTWRVETRGPDPFAEGYARNFLGATWHRNLLMAAGIFRDTGVHVAVSSSRDGEHITAVMAHLGLGRAIRGSSTRSGVTALRGMLRVARDDGALGILPDGPKGPARLVKLSARPCLRFGSWDRMLLPLPFARVVCHFGESVAIERDADPEKREAARLELEAKLEQLTRAADAALR